MQESELSYSHNFGNRLFSFFGWLGYYSDLAIDVRIYLQDKTCDRYNRNKEDTFESNGLFAYLAWLPHWIEKCGQVS